MTELLTDASAAAFTAIPEVDLRRWHGGDAERARARPARSARSATRSGSSSSSATACPDGFRARHFDLLQAFFALPEDVKAQIDKVRSPHFRGWERGRLPS